MNKELGVACRKDEESLLLDYTASAKWEDIANLEWSTAEVMEVMRQYRTLVEEKFTSTNTGSPKCPHYKPLANCVWQGDGSNNGISCSDAGPCVWTLRAGA